MLTSELDPVDLLAGPRGRRLCLELAQRADDDVARRVFYAAHDLDPGAGTSRVVMFGPGAAGRPQASPQDVADAISRAALLTLNDLTLMQAIDSAVAAARYWQEPDGEDVLAATPTVRAALEPVARAVVAAPAARWWTTALDTTAQCRVSWGRGRPTTATAGPRPRSGAGSVAGRGRHGGGDRRPRASDRSGGAVERRVVVHPAVGHPAHQPALQAASAPWA